MEYNIVIPFDFSEQSRKVLKSAVDVCRHVNAALHLVHVLPSDADEKTVQQTQAELTAAANRFECPVSSVVLKGTIGRQVLSYAGGVKNPVLFLSNSEDTESRPSYTGPNAHYIIANSTFPVMVLKTNLDMKKVNTVLVPIDLELENRLKLTYAMFLSRFFSNAVIRLLTVVYDADDFELHRHMLRLNKLTSFFEKTGILAVGEIVRCYEEDGELYSKIAVDYAEKSDAELILLITNDEKCVAGCGVSREADYMLANYKSNILSITPFVQ